MKIAACLIPLFLVGCAAHVHQVGKGSKEYQAELAMMSAQTKADSALVAGMPKGFAPPMSKKQFYLLNWIPLNQVDSRNLALRDENYTIETKHTVLDVIIEAATLGIITSRTVTVRR